MKTYKNFPTFCIKVIILLVILLAVDRIIGILFIKMKDSGLKNNPENVWAKTPFIIEKLNDDCLIIGSSKASHHYVPEIISKELGIRTYNCGQDGCFFLYQNCMINIIMDRYHPKMILWDIQPSSFMDSNPALEYQNFRYLSPYYPQNKWVKNFIESESKKMPFRMLSQMFAYNSKFLNYVFPLVTHNSNTQNGYSPLPSEGYPYPRYETEDSVYNKNIMPEYLQLLEETIKRCQANGTEIGLYISPVYAKKNTCFHKAETAIEKIAEHNGVKFFNYHSSELFMNDPTLFKDAHHLNDKGARLYTHMVTQDWEKRKGRVYD